MKLDIGRWVKNCWCVEEEKEGKFKKIQKKSYPINKEKESETL